MKISTYIILLLLNLSAYWVKAQSSSLVRGGKEEWLINRLDVLAGNKEMSFSSNKPYYRRQIVNVIAYNDSVYAFKNKAIKGITEIDKYNMQRFLMANSDYSKHKEIYKSEKPFLNTFFVNRANMFEKKEKNYSFIINPIFNYQIGNKADASKSNFINQRGISLRGLIDNKIAFTFYFTENQERQPLYVQQWKTKYFTYPAAGFIKTFKNDGVDFFDPRGSLNWNVGKHINMELAYDKNFIGNGYRSLLLSDFGMNYMFMKVKYDFGKFRYQNIYAELVRARNRIGSDYIYPRKYFRASYLSLQATKNINIGVFEGLIFNNTDGIRLPLFNPVMFTNFSGNEKDKSYGGFDLKINMLKKFQLYAQGMIDGITFDERLAQNWWGNRFAYQAGVKYINAFEIKNLDVQVEANFVRPYMYASFDSVSSYNHYNQPLAHPLGANFTEYIGIIKYQPLKQLYVEAKVVMYNQGLDSVVLGSSRNYGSNIIALEQTRPSDFGYTLPSGINIANCMVMQFLASYEVKENLFIDFSLLNRNFKLPSSTTTTNLFSLGLRWNIGRKEYLF